MENLKSVLFCHAHPDDETLVTGALICELLSQKIACDVLTATRGEKGEVVAGSLTLSDNTSALCERRETELAGALTILGVRNHCWLGELPARDETRLARRYLDSGMEWIRPGLAGPAVDVAATSLTSAPLEEAIADVTAVIAAWSPDLVVSYADDGGYGHPDHVRMHQIAKVAASRSQVDFAEIRHQKSDGVLWYDLPQHQEQVAAALRCHATQLTVQPSGDEVVHSGGQREKIVTSVGLARHVFSKQDR
ncbi:MAG: PIG-L family deacetylase [Propionibacteriaceae bacterium]